MRCGLTDSTSDKAAIPSCATCVFACDRHVRQRQEQRKRAPRIERLTVIDQSRQMLDLPFDDLVLGRHGIRTTTAQQLQRSHDGRERIAQFVSEHGKEFVFRPANTRV
jgi:hypothetical protein